MFKDKLSSQNVKFVIYGVKFVIWYSTWCLLGMQTLLKTGYFGICGLPIKFNSEANGIIFNKS